MKQKLAKATIKKASSRKGRIGPSKRSSQTQVGLSTFLTTLAKSEPSLSPSQMKMFAAYASGSDEE